MERLARQIVIGFGARRIGEKCSTGRPHAAKPASPNDAAINFRTVRRELPSSSSRRVRRKLVVNPLAELRRIGQLIQAAPVLLAGARWGPGC